MTGEYILQTVGLTKTFAGFTAVNKVNLNVRRGTIHALIGPNGAGKTTCFNLITKILPASGGKILYRGRDISRATPHAVARLGLVRLFQISAVFPHLSVLENVRVALQRKLGTSYHIWRPASSVEVLNDRALELLSPGFSPMPRCPRSNYPMAASAL
jgi:branched-chain amino acid transport system ATP-binding protein